MDDERSLQRLCKGCTEAEIDGIYKHLDKWTMGTYGTVAQSVLDHADRKEFSPLRYLRKAHNFNKRGAVRVPKSGARLDSSIVYRKGNEF